MSKKLLYPILLLLSSVAIVTQAQSIDCPLLVQQALDLTRNLCEDIGRNQACYGNITLQAEIREGVEATFEQPGDVVDVTAVEMLTLTSLNADTDEWGVAMMQLQANLPDTLPGQNVTFLFFGDVEIENAVAESTEPVTIEVSASGNLNVRGGPSTSNAIVGSLTAGQSVQADGRILDGSWLRIQSTGSDASIGWVFAPLVTPATDITTLAIVDSLQPVETVSAMKPMQAVYFRTGVGDSPCRGAPDSGVLIQTPEGAGEVELIVNEVNITLGSSIFVQADDQLVVNTLDGFARVSAFSEIQTATAGTRVTVPLDARGAASGPPAPPQPYDLSTIYTTAMTIGNDIISSLPATPEDFGGQLCGQLEGMPGSDSFEFGECSKLLVAYGAVEGADEHILEIAERANAVEAEYFSYTWPYQPDDESEARAARIWQENSLIQMQEDLRVLEGYIAAGKTLVLDMDLYLKTPGIGDSLRPYIDRTLWENADLWETVELDLNGLYGTLQLAEVLDPLAVDETVTEADSGDIAGTDSTAGDFTLIEGEWVYTSTCIIVWRGETGEKISEGSWGAVTNLETGPSLVNGWEKTGPGVYTKSRFLDFQNSQGQTTRSERTMYIEGPSLVREESVSYDANTEEGLYRTTTCERIITPS